jgi:myo-inositol-1(or 4)-monophosphatase
MIDPNKIKNWMKTASGIALQHFQRAKPRHKADHTLVTEADVVVEDFLVTKIRNTYPNHGIIAEEGTRALGAEYSWVVDPIDGTAAFIWGVPTWCISIGVLKEMQPYFGIVYVPLTDEVFSAYIQKEALWNNRPIHLTDDLPIDKDTVFCISARTLQKYTISFPGSVCSLGSGIMHHCLVARGAAAGSLTLQPNLWDLAGVYPILKAAGATLLYLSGEPVKIDELSADHAVSQPIVSGHPNTVRQLIRMVKHKDQPEAKTDDD